MFAIMQKERKSALLVNKACLIVPAGASHNGMLLLRAPLVRKRRS